MIFETQESMSYEVIARKYRPKRFEDVVGQEHVTRTLANAIKLNRIAHAYLFVGPRGTGKTTIARIFAKCLNCVNGPRTDFSDDDPQCKEISEGRSLDVLEIDGASNRGIEEIRALRETISYLPTTSRFKIYIIDEVHMLTKEAFNALLKTLEEPPPHVKFMFATTEPEKVPATIMSRCQRFDLRRIPVRLITKHLAEIARKENIQIDDLALYAIARGADGCMRDAESALDQLISFCGNAIREADVLSMFGLTSRQNLSLLAKAILAGDAPTAVVKLQELDRNGKDLGRLLSDLISYFRNLLLIKICKGDAELLEISETEIEELVDLSKKASIDQLRAILEVLTQCEVNFREAFSKKIVLELAIVEAARAKDAVSIESILSTLAQLDSQQSPLQQLPAANINEYRSAAEPQEVRAAVLTGDNNLPTTQSEPEIKPPAPQQPESAETVIADFKVNKAWNALLSAVSDENPLARVVLDNAKTVNLENGQLTITFDDREEITVNVIDSPRIKELIVTIFKKHGITISDVVFKTRVNQNTAAIGEGSDNSDTNKSQAAVNESEPKKGDQSECKPDKISIEDFKNDPLIRDALEIFKAQIVGTLPYNDERKNNQN